MPKKIQVLVDHVEKVQSMGDDRVSLHVDTLSELLLIAAETANYFGYPRKAKPGVHREGREKFNKLIDALGAFDFGSYAPDEMREDDQLV